MQDKINYEPKLRSIGKEGSLSWVAADRHKMLNNILSVIHRDGGHAQDKLGFSESCAMAEEKIISMFSALNECSQHAERAIAKLDDDVSPYSSLNKILTITEKLKQN